MPRGGKSCSPALTKSRHHRVKPSPFLSTFFSQKSTKNHRTNNDSVNNASNSYESWWRLEFSQYLSLVLYSFINICLLFPVAVSFCAIIFRDAVFIPFMPRLVKLVLFSCAMHQLCFTIFSSLPFAVGQVQDAGLIFLSAIAASIAHSVTHEEQLLPTTLVILALCTALLGVLLIIVSKLKLASAVQYLPMPVIGGYLGKT